MGASLDICILGDGMTGCALALTLSAQGMKVGLVMPDGHDQTAKMSPADVRAFSLNAAARQILSNLDAWPKDDQICAVQRIAVWGDRGGHIEFCAGQEPALSWIVEARCLLDLLRERVHGRSDIRLLERPQAATLTAICEGSNSSSRRALGMAFERQPYGQHALACRVWHEQPHRSCARQWFSGSADQASILALLPLVDAHQSALIWSQSSRLAQARRGLSREQLAHDIALAAGSALGSMSVQSECSVWPLQSAMAHPWTGVGPDGGAFVLLGDAAHQIHPLAGLGLNLGLGDVATLGHLLQQRQSLGQSTGVGDRRLLRQYERKRKLDVAAVNGVCDGLYALFSHSAYGVRWLRNRGLSCVNRFDFFKQWLMTQATHLERFS